MAENKINVKVSGNGFVIESVSEHGEAVERLAFQGANNSDDYIEHVREIISKGIHKAFFYRHKESAE